MKNLVILQINFENIFCRSKRIINTTWNGCECVGIIFSSCVVDLSKRKDTYYTKHILLFFYLVYESLLTTHTLIFRLDDETRQDKTRSRKFINDKAKKEEFPSGYGMCVQKWVKMCARFVWKMSSSESKRQRSALPFRHVNYICVNFFLLLCKNFSSFFIYWNHACVFFSLSFNYVAVLLLSISLEFEWLEIARERVAQRQQ